MDEVYLVRVMEPRQVVGGLTPAEGAALMAAISALESRAAALESAVAGLSGVGAAIDDLYGGITYLSGVLDTKADASHTHALSALTGGVVLQKSGIVKTSKLVNIPNGATDEILSTTVPTFGSSRTTGWMVTVSMEVFGSSGYTGDFYIRCLVNGTMYESGLLQADQGVDSSKVLVFSGEGALPEATNFVVQTRCASGIYTIRSWDWSWFAGLKG